MRKIMSKCQKAKFGFLPLGPYVGKLSNEGDHIVLNNAANVIQDEVEYQSGFPWPTSARGLGPSMELIHPSLDNNLGGSWRSGGTFASAEVVYLNEASNSWKYFRGTEEASDPVSDWRQSVFDDADWTTATTPVGYGGGYVVNTAITGMQGVHSTMYYRNAFTIAAGQVPESLSLRIKYDDGAIVWINGEEVARLKPTDATWESVHEPVSKLSFLLGPEFETTIASGTYRVEVSTPENFGKYIIVLGDADVHHGFGATWSAVSTLYEFAGVTKLGMVRTSLVYVPLLTLLILGGFGYTVYRTRDRLPFLKRHA
jgi:hypothetical protein